MRRAITHKPGILLLTMMSLFSAVVGAEIYKWVDADGKVHFGDQPHDPNKTLNAQPVEVEENYLPSERSEPEQETYDSEQRKIMLRDQMRRREEKEAQDEADARRREQKTALCAAYEEGIKELSTVEINNGVRTLVYVKGEDGKSVSTERQREIIEELKAKMADAGCT